MMKPDRKRGRDRDREREITSLAAHRQPQLEDLLPGPRIVLHVEILEGIVGDYLRVHVRKLDGSSGGSIADRLVVVHPLLS